MPRWAFDAKLARPEGVGTWTYAPIPPEVSRAVGSTGRVRVLGTVDGKPFATSLLPTGEGGHFVVVPAALRETIGKAAGDVVRIRMDLDSRPVRVRVPPDLLAAIQKNPAARRYFDGLAPSHRKAYVAWIKEAKKRETRRARIDKAVTMLASGKLAK